ncbi:N-formylglutamate amidohydrolase [Pelagibacteraceae bacterium]|nr:N-formylglutamate amidohydrolase [Pelagibacteraceae bacterium]
MADHASNYIFPYKKNLHLSKKQINSHIAYDIGIKELTEQLALKLKAHYVLGELSRLYIDLNRDSLDPTLIPVISDRKIILGNIDISKKDLKKRMQYYYKS